MSKSRADATIYKNGECERLIAQKVDSPNALCQEYAQDTSQPKKGQIEDVVLKGKVEKGGQNLIPLRAEMDDSSRTQTPGSMAIRGWEYVAMPPTEFSSESVKKAYSDFSGKWRRGRHSIPVDIDLNGDHEADTYDRYPLMWSIPGKLKLASSRESAVEIKGKIMLRNERAELVETKDYYCVKIWDDHIDNLSHNIRADGYIMHFDNDTQTWWRLSQLKYIFNHTEGRGNCYGQDIPTTSQWLAPDYHWNESPPKLYGDFVVDDKNDLIE